MAHLAHGGCEVLSAVIAGVRFSHGDLRVSPPVGASRAGSRPNPDQGITCPGGSGLGQELLDNSFGLAAFAFAEVVDSRYAPAASAK